MAGSASCGTPPAATAWTAIRSSSTCTGPAAWAGRPGDHRRESDLLGQALDGWQAAALAGLTGEWAARIRAALYGERSELLARRAEAQLRLGRYDEVVDELRGPVSEDPIAEGLV